MMAEQTVTKKPLWFLLILIITQVALAASLMSRERILSSLETEVAYMEGLYGQTATDELVNRSIVFSERVYIESGIINQVKKFLIPRHYLNGTLNESDALYSVWETVDEVVGNIYIAIAYTTLRVLSFAYWLPLAILVGVPAVITGYLLREIKKESFEYSSPLRFGVSQKFLYMMPLVVYIMLVFPLPISPVFIVVSIIVFAISLAVFISNAIKRV
ncbi:DUF4400 domain-containing protein [Vibrio mediterranei]|uniref:DUF4400 domain-containing protein n=1 Tax=Vibrio mediterranei TaxID=689 RepID=UPI004068FC02